MVRDAETYLYGICGIEQTILYTGMRERMARSCNEHDLRRFAGVENDGIEMTLNGIAIY